MSQLTSFFDFYISVTWMKGLTDITITRRTLKETINDYTRLTLTRAQLTDAGTYFIMAKNKYGSDRAFFTLRVSMYFEFLFFRMNSFDQLTSSHITMNY